MENKCRMSLFAILGVCIILFMAYLLYLFITPPHFPSAVNYQQSKSLCLEFGVYIRDKMSCIPWDKHKKSSAEPNNANEFIYLYISSIDDFHITDKNLNLIDTDQDGLLEIGDFWGNPIVFILGPSEYYKFASGKSTTRIQIDGIVSQTSFALWSIGKNGKNEFGGGDDVGWTCIKIKNNTITHKGKLKDNRIIWTPYISRSN